MTNIELSNLYSNMDARHCVRGQLLKTSESELYPDVVRGNIDVYTDRLMKIVCADPAVTEAASPFDENGQLLTGITPALEQAANYALANPDKVALIRG